MLVDGYKEYMYYAVPSCMYSYTSTTHVLSNTALIYKNCNAGGSESTYLFVYQSHRLLFT